MRIIYHLTQVQQHGPGRDWLLESVCRLLGELETLLADVEHELGQPLLADTADDALGVHLPQPQQENRSALLVVVMPATRKIVLYDGRLLKSISGDFRNSLKYFLFVVSKRACIR